MKTVHGPHNDNEDCSCASCIYKSESDRPSLRNIVAQGSRIDRLYYGKYIPLREKKLLDRLVRTRAVYDDIRAQLISNSTIDLNKKANLKLRNTLSGKQLDNIDKSSAVLKLVNMVDKGEILSSKNLSECCSCCSCSTGLHLHNETLKKQRHKRGHPGAHRHEYRTSEKVGDVYTKQRGVRFKAKHIRSDPCTCTFQFSGLLQNLSNTKMRKMRSDRPSPALDLFQSTDVEIRQKRRNLKRSQERLTGAIVEGIKKLNESKVKLRENLELRVKKSLDKLNQAKENLKSKSKAHLQINIYEHPSKIEFASLCECPELDLLLDIKKGSLSKFKEGIKKINQEIKESKTKIIESLEIQVKKSLDKLKKAKDKIKTRTQKSPYGAICACPELDLISHIRKDSIAKFKDDIRKKQMLKDWACNFECIEDICKPEKCFDKLKRKHSSKIRAHGKHDLTERKKIKQERKIGEPTSVSSVKIQALQKTAAVPVETKRVKPKLRTKQTKVTSSRMQFKHKPFEMHNENKLPSTESCNCKTVSKDKNQPQKRREDRILKKDNTEHLKINQQRQIKKIEVKANKLESGVESRPRQAVRIGSSFSFNIEFYKDKKEHKPPLPIKYYDKNRGLKKLNRRHRGSQGLLKHRVKDAKIGAQALNRCFCTLQLKGKKQKINKEIKEETLFTKGTVTGFNDFNTPCTRNSCIFSDKCIMTNCKRMKAKNKNLPKMQQENIHYTQNLLPYECEPGICTPNYCDPYQCIKLINIRKTKIKKSSVKCGCPRKSKSTSSLTSKSNKPSKAKYVQSVIEYTRKPKKVRGFAEKRPNLRRQIVNNMESSRQTVRIGSTFSFNIEFHKNKFPNSATPANRRNLSIKPKRNLHLNPNLKKKKNTTPTQHVLKRNRFYGVGSTLKRCFCTLKLQEKYMKTKKHKMLTTGTKTEENLLMDVITSNKSTKIDRKNMRQLEPFECEPFVCIPGECDPYKCLERIKKRLKDASITATQPVLTAGSSTIYSEISSKTIQVDTKPKSKHEKTYMKAKKRKENLKKTYDPMERQAVRIGSSFNFNIELYKKNIPTHSTSEYLKQEKGKKIVKNKTLDKDIKTSMFTVSDIDTQIQRPNKHKASMVRPLLKRCFCTLNLQKKQKQRVNTYNFPPRVYTVNRASNQEYKKRSCSKLNKPNSLISYQLYNAKSTCKCLQHNYEINPAIEGINSPNLYSISLYKLISKLSAEFNTQNIDSEFHKIIVSQTKSFISISQNGNSKTLISEKNAIKVVQEHLRPGASSFNLKQTPLTYVNQNIRNCFCAMNLQIERKPFKKPLKLLPYECEPGVCIPGNCNPYECQKLILNRNIKRTTSKVGTAYNTESVSSQYTPKLKKNKKNAYLQESSTIKRYKNHHSNIANHVRIGSSFNFDIEFFKNTVGKNSSEKKYSSDSNLAKHKRQLKTLRNAGTKKLRYFNDSQSQAELAVTSHKSSANLPIIQRCFCTLKLQKKGRLHKESNHRIHKKLLMQDPDLYQSSVKVKSTNKGQNTKPLKPTYHLATYECEPNICNPGYCDPYQCLEIMKRKRVQATGVHTVWNNKKSMTSMTTTNQSKGTQKSHVKQKVTKTRSKITKASNESSSLKPSSKVVRVGSNFSFNVEFFKDHSESSPFHKISKESKEPMKHSEHKNKNLKHQKSQIRNISQVASTMTSSFLKRCFCTAKLYQNNKKKNFGLNLQNNASPSFFERCLCWFKSKKHEKIGKNNKRNKIKNLNKKTITQDIDMNIDKNLLDRFECDPGMCIPGECNPYECDAILRKKMKRQSIGSSTETYKSRSAFTYNPIHTTKKVNTHLVKERRKQPALNKTALEGSEKQLVRIGSNFSFNIEFYKDKNPKHDKSVSKSLALQPRSRERQNKFRGKGTTTKNGAISTHSRLSETLPYKKKDRGIGVKNIVKRCFCTLQLYNGQKQEKPYKVKAKTKSIMTERNKIRSNGLLPFECEPNICIPYQCDPYKCDKIMKSRKNRYGQHNLTLLPYECEPLSCIPGECNPVECLERINKRQLRDMGTSILSNKYAAKTMTENKFKPRNKINQAKFSQLSKVEKEHEMTREKSSKQAVKIGSKFSFDIEFYKDKTNNENIRKRVKNDKSFKNHEQDAYPRDSKSRKVTNLVHKKISKPTMGPFLKKCFCTLKLAKIKAKQGNNMKPVKKKELMKNQMHQAVLLPHTNVTKFSRQLEPYECEPGTCVPGLCNPYECEKRIKKRFKEFSQETKNPIQSSKFIATKSIRTKSVKLQALKMYKDKRQLRNKVHAYHDKPDEKKQVCHIGSSFSFDIQFYKNKYPKDDITNKRILSSDADKLNKNSLYSQTKIPKKKVKSSSMAPILKRCFCTLKLQKIPVDSTSSPKDVKRTHKGINCDPYECEKQTQMCQNPKCRDISSQADKRCSDKCVGFKPQKRKTRYNQSNSLRTHDASSNIHAQKQEIVEVPRFSNIFDKQAVKIGSNFSFNIEFYKKTLLPINSVTPSEKRGFADETRIKRSVPKTLALYNRGSQINAVSSKDEAVDAKNALKRCFCTLKLQNQNSKAVKKRLHTTPHYPQVVEVRRIAVQRKPKKEFQKTNNPVKSVSTRINNKYLKFCSNTNNRCLDCITIDANEMKTILPYRPVRFNKTSSRTLLSRHMNNNLYNQKDITITRRGKRLTKKKSLRGIDFERAPKPNLKENTATLNIKNIFCRCIQLLNTKKKDHRIANIPNESQNLEISNVHNKIAVQRSKQYAPDSLKVSKSDRRPAQPNRTEPKKSKSLKLGSIYNNIKCQKECPIFNHRYSIYQAGDNDPNSSLKYKNKKHKDPGIISNDVQRKQIFNRLTTVEDIYCACNETQQRIKKQKFAKNESLCWSCQTKMQEKINKNKSSSRRLKVRFLDPLSLSKDNVIQKNADKEKNKKPNKNKYSKSLNYCTFCNCCGRIINDETTQKAAGDNFYLNRQQPSVSDKIKNISKHMNKAKSKKKSPMFDLKINADDYGILNKDEIIDNITNLSGQNINKSTIKPQINCACGKADDVELKVSTKGAEKAVSRPVKDENLKNRQKVASKKKNKLFKHTQPPVLEMQINSDDYNILNKEEFHDKIAKLSEKNITDKSVSNKSCQKCSRCCMYLAKHNKKLNAKDQIRRPNFKKGPCVCGSLTCAEKSKKMTVEEDKLRRPKKRKPCLCGSPICDHESAVMKSLSVSPDKMTCICKKMRDKEKKKVKKKKDKQENKLRDIRLQQQRKEDKVRLRKRKKENRQLEKKINKNSSDIILLAESVVDIGKLGITACSDVLRVIARTAVDPKHAYRTLKAMKQDPSLIARHVHHAVDDSGVVSTVRRVRLRCMAMKGVKNIKAVLESHPFTNYLLHIAAKDPKRRELKKKNLRVRERLDFGCSLYMGSLRKRPFLYIYDRLPSFYPHFLALVNVYKQFKDLLLFLLAVVVWSPCIVCMEVCRAMMCCLFCTG